MRSSLHRIWTSICFTSPLAVSAYLLALQSACVQQSAGAGVGFIKLAVNGKMPLINIRLHHGKSMI